MPFAVYVLGMAIFSMGTTEMMLSGLLPLLSADLSVSIPTAALLVSGFALGMAIGGPLLTVFFARLEPKRILIILLALFVVGQSIGAVAPTYAVLMVSRVIAARWPWARFFLVLRHRLWSAWPEDTAGPGRWPSWSAGSPCPV
ncbi:MFS transporter [Fodinicola feengrottensis]|uniref:MFS transporter n=1 Tax=Fodinicola feengrottensis TaxID=435914 RepID=UPI0013D39D07|nr:MFS transporter [Fodinicola feengrottensis]